MSEEYGEQRMHENEEHEENARTRIRITVTPYCRRGRVSSLPLCLCDGDGRWGSEDGGSSPL